VNVNCWLCISLHNLCPRWTYQHAVQMNRVPMHSRDDADSEYVSWVDHKGVEFIGNKQTYNTQLYILVQQLPVNAMHSNIQHLQNESKCSTCSSGRYIILLNIVWLGHCVTLVTLVSWPRISLHWQYISYSRNWKVWIRQPNYLQRWFHQAFVGRHLWYACGTLLYKFTMVWPLLMLESTLR